MGWFFVFFIFVNSMLNYLFQWASIQKIENWWFLNDYIISSLRNQVCHFLCKICISISYTIYIIFQFLEFIMQWWWVALSFLSFTVWRKKFAYWYLPHDHSIPLFSVHCKPISFPFFSSQACTSSRGRGTSKPWLCLAELAIMSVSITRVFKS